MLPSAKNSLIDGGYSPKQATWTMVVCFLGGVIGIQILSNIMHHFIPSHIIDCEHTHEEAPVKENGASDDRDHAHDHDHSHAHQPRPQTPRSSLPGHIMSPGSGRRRASRQTSYFGSGLETSESIAVAETNEHPPQPSNFPEAPLLRRPSLQERVTSTISQIATGKKSLCDHNGPCHGFSDPCGQECFKNINARRGFRAPHRLSSATMKPSISRSATTASVVQASEHTPLLHDIAEEERSQTDNINHAPTRYYTTNTNFSQGQSGDSTDTLEDANNDSDTLQKTDTLESAESNHPDVHHHHVPTNAFLSIGLQTSIAIALHKLPEGFITYATNHANPKLGVSVFLALFIHNITEGFAMALPLYLAINSRVKAMLISFVLGGLSQPMGAAVAAVWFKLAGQGDWAPSEGVYGGMFAVTAGIMASVALQLFSESLDLTHSRALCMIGAFTGMGILGVSSALTA